MISAAAAAAASSTLIGDSPCTPSTITARPASPTPSPTSPRRRRQAARRRPDAHPDDEAAARRARPRLSTSARSPNSSASSATATRSSIGAMTRHADVADQRRRASGDPGARRSSPAASAIPPVRNRGTIGGSLANNDPAADYPAAALALGATIVTNKRQIAADDYLQGPVRDGAGARTRSSPHVQLPDPAEGGLREVPQPGLALRAGRRVRRQDGRRRARRGDRRGRQRRVPRQPSSRRRWRRISRPPRSTATAFRRAGSTPTCTPTPTIAPISSA